MYWELLEPEHLAICTYRIRIEATAWVISYEDSICQIRLQHYVTKSG